MAMLSPDHQDLMDRYMLLNANLDLQKKRIAQVKEYSNRLLKILSMSSIPLRFMEYGCSQITYIKNESVMPYKMWGVDGLIAAGEDPIDLKTETIYRSDGDIKEIFCEYRSDRHFKHWRFRMRVPSDVSKDVGEWMKRLMYNLIETDIEPRSIEGINFAEGFAQVHIDVTEMPPF